MYYRISGWSSSETGCMLVASGTIENASYLLTSFFPVPFPVDRAQSAYHSASLPITPIISHAFDLRHHALTTTLFPLPFRSNLDLRRTIITLLVYPLNDIGHIRVTETRSWYRLLYEFNSTFSAMLNTRFMRIASGPTVCIPIDPTQTTYFGKQ